MEFRRLDLRLLLGIMRANFGDEMQARAATKAAMLQTAQLRMSGLLARTSTPIERAKLEQGIQALGAQRAQEAQKHNLQLSALAGSQSVEWAKIRAAGARAGGEGELDAPGWVRTPDAPAIKREEAVGFRTSVASARDLNQTSARMRGLIRASGSELFGPKSAEMAVLSRDMLLKMKDLAKLGVLSANDESILNDLIPNPSGAGAVTTRTATMLKQLDAFDEAVNRKLNTQAYSLGYARPGGK